MEYSKSPTTANNVIHSYEIENSQNAIIYCLEMENYFFLSKKMIPAGGRMYWGKSTQGTLSVLMFLMRCGHKRV